MDPKSIAEIPITPIQRSNIVSMPASVFTTLAVINAVAFVAVAFLMTHQQTLMRARLSEQQKLLLESFERQEQILVDGITKTGSRPAGFEFHAPGK